MNGRGLLPAVIGVPFGHGSELLATLPRYCGSNGHCISWASVVYVYLGLHGSRRAWIQDGGTTFKFFVVVL